MWRLHTSIVNQQTVFLNTTTRNLCFHPHAMITWSLPLMQHMRLATSCRPTRIALRAHGGSGCPRTPAAHSNAGVAALSGSRNDHLRGSQHIAMKAPLNRGSQIEAQVAAIAVHFIKADRFHGCCCPYSLPKPPSQTLGDFHEGAPMPLTGITQIQPRNHQSCP